MKLWILVGLFSAASIPWAAASEITECGLDQRQTARVEAPAPALEGPAAERDVRKAARPAREAETATTQGQRATPRVDRRRYGSARRIPDAMLIDGRGAL